MTNTDIYTAVRTSTLIVSSCFYLPDIQNFCNKIISEVCRHVKNKTYIYINSVDLINQVCAKMMTVTKRKDLNLNTDIFVCHVSIDNTHKNFPLQYC